MRSDHAVSRHVPSAPSPWIIRCLLASGLVAAGNAHATAAGDPQASPVPPLKHVMIVIFENKDARATLAQPFFGKLAQDGAYLSNFHAETHPSQPNYIALTSGSMHGVADDRSVDLDVTHIGDLLEAKGKSWKVYAEGYPGDCFTGAHSGRYVRKHNPFVSYTNVTANAARCARIVDAAELATDVAAGTLPDYAFFVPDMDDDAHDTTLAFADAWYQKTFAPLTADPKFMDGMLLITTFDESAPGGGNLIYTSLYGPMVQPGATTDQSADHLSLLRTIEDGLGIGTLGLGDDEAETIVGIWR